MAVTYVIDADAGIVMATATGPTTAQDLADYQVRVAADPAFRRTYHLLFDFRMFKPIDIFGDQVERLMHTSPLSSASRRAFVVSPGVVYGLARMAELMSERRLSVQVFEDIEAARQWLLEAASA